MSVNKIKVILVAGARPNFMKCAPILRELDGSGSFDTLFVHTGQHYDYNMSSVFFKNLKLRPPDIFLNVGSAPRLTQIRKIGARFEKVAAGFGPDIVIVVGDVNSTLAAGLAAKKIGALLAHVEAGLRSYDNSMPEEMNRVCTDSIADLLFTTSPDASANLIKEGLSRERIHFVGNVMIDTLASNLKLAERSRVLDKLKLKKRGYYLLTLHRPSNVDDKKTLKGILEAVMKAAGPLKVVFPVHPRTEKMLKTFRLFDRLKERSGFITTRPLGYLDFLKLLKHTRMVFTDSGGIQEETAYLKVPCLTLRKNTERPITIAAGTNIIAGNTRQGIIRSFNLISRRHIAAGPIRLWDGRAAKRIVKILKEKVR